MKTRFWIRAAIIAALYAALTLVWPLSFGQVQIRVSEALCVLPLFTPAAVPGLFAGCLVSGILGGAVWFDVALGSLTTLAAAHCARRLRDRALPIPLLPPVLFNAVVVGAVAHFAYAGNPSLSALPISMLAVGAGQTVACVGLGLPLFRLLSRAPASLWEDPDAARRRPPRVPEK